MSTDCVHGLAARLPGGAHGSVLKNLPPPPKKNKMLSLASFLDLSNHPVFDHLQYAKTERGEGGLVHFITWMIYLGEEGVSKDKPQARSFDGGLLPRLSTKVDTDDVHMIKWTRPLPSVFVYCGRSKTGWWSRRPGNEDSFLLCPYIIKLGLLSLEIVFRPLN